MALPPDPYTPRQRRNDKIKATLLLAFGLGMIWAMFSRPSHTPPPAPARSYRAVTW